MSVQENISKTEAVEKSKQQIPSLEIELQSGGKVYPKEKSISSGKVTMRYMKGEDEEILISPAYFKENKTFDVLLNRLIIDPDFDPMDLTIADKEHLVLSARVMSLGDDFKMEEPIKCQSCGRVHNDVEMKLSSVKEKEITQEPDELHKNEFLFTLPTTEQDIKLKVLTTRDQKEIEQYFDGSNLHIKDEEIGTYSVAKAIVSAPNLGDTFGERVRFVKEMPLKDLRAIRQFLESISGGTDFTIDHTCERCSHVQPVRVNFGLGFFL